MGFSFILFLGFFFLHLCKQRLSSLRAVELNAPSPEEKLLVDGLSNYPRRDWTLTRACAPPPVHRTGRIMRQANDISIVHVNTTHITSAEARLAIRARGVACDRVSGVMAHTVFGRIQPATGLLFIGWAFCFHIRVSFFIIFP